MSNLSRWLDVEVGTDDIELNSLPSNLALVDLQNDSEYKLVVGDLGRAGEGSKIKIFKGAMQIADVVLPDLPLGLLGFYTSETSPRSPPVVAVAFSSCVYMYRNMKLFYKYYLPAMELNSSEIEVWKQVGPYEDIRSLRQLLYILTRNYPYVFLCNSLIFNQVQDYELLVDTKNHQSDTISSLSESLKALTNEGLSVQSLKFLSLTEDDKLDYLEQTPQVPEKNKAEITCITTMKHSSIDKYSACCLVVGTEDGDVIILDPMSFTTLFQAKLCEIKRTPYQMVTTGLYTVDYRITIATREKCVCLLKREWKEGRVLFNTDEHIIAIEVMTHDHSVMVISTDNTLACYSKKGKKQWSIILEHRPIAMTLLPMVHLGVVLVGVALASGHMQLYDMKAQVDSMFVRDVVSVMKFGQLGQEEHVLIIITASGNLMLKILKRTADFNIHATSVEASQGATSPHSRPWLIPKKSKLFLEQSMRERENAVAMHETFQWELNRLRLTAAKTLLEAYQKSDNSIGVGALEPVRLSAEVAGLGPVFRVTLVVQNTACDKAVVGLAVLFHVHNASYKVAKPYIKVPLLSPGSTLKFPTKIEEVFSGDVNPDVFFRSVTGQGGERSLVKILLLKEGRPSPVLAATVQMPPTDPMMLPYDKITGTGSAGFGQRT